MQQKLFLFNAMAVICLHSVSYIPPSGLEIIISFPSKDETILIMPFSQFNLEEPIMVVRGIWVQQKPKSNLLEKGCRDHFFE
jgi:hypothetical protein